MISLKEVKTTRNKLLEDTLATEIWYSIYFIRRFSYYLTWLSIVCKLSANSITIISYLVGILSAIFFSLGTNSGFVVGLLLLHLSFVVDNVDGEVARCTNTQSLTGAYLDTLGHIIINSMVNFGLGLGLYFYTGWTWILYAGIGAGFFYIPISRYSADHEIVNRLRKIKNQHYVNSGAERIVSTKLSNTVIENLTGNIKNLMKKVGFPFVATPYNILALTISIVLDFILDVSKQLSVNINFTALLITYYCIILFLQQTASLTRQVKSRLIDVEVDSLQ